MQPVLVDYLIERKIIYQAVNSALIRQMVKESIVSLTLTFFRVNFNTSIEKPIAVDDTLPKLRCRKLPRVPWETFTRVYTWINYFFGVLFLSAVDCTL